MNHDAILAFADGTVFTGQQSGYCGIAVGEAVFNTAITGYQEIITDPSYHRQLVNFTHPHIGNTGITPLDNESPQVFVAGIIARQITHHHSNWRATQSLPEFLQTHHIVAIDNIDTRAVTRKLRDGGAMAVCLAPGTDEIAITEAKAAARAFAGLQGAMLAGEAGTSRPVTWHEGLWRAASNDYDINAPKNPTDKSVVVLDCGVKSAILRHLVNRGCQLTVMPYETNINTVLAQNPDGVVFSNGPGDPEPCTAALALAQALLNKKIPLLGICLGHQILATALGAKTVKMKFGHHGANHPVRDKARKRVLITSQNHGFTVDADSLPESVRVTHVSLFDGSLQGLICDTPPVITFQGHPEANPGPQDADFLFDDFMRMMNKQRTNA